MTWIVNFLHVLTIEYLQNVLFVVGLVLGLAGIKRGYAWWKCLLVMIGGSFSCAAVISALDEIKVMATTRTSGPPTLAGVLFMGVIFSVGCGLLLAYIALTDRLKRTYAADAAFGVLLGSVSAVIEAGNIPPLLVLLHALGFAAAGGCLVAILRRVADASSRRALLASMGLVNLLMSVLISIFDYAPFVRG